MEKQTTNANSCKQSHYPLGRWHLSLSWEITKLCLPVSVFQDERLSVALSSSDSSNIIINVIKQPQDRRIPSYSSLSSFLCST